LRQGLNALCRYRQAQESAVRKLALGRLALGDVAPQIVGQSDIRDRETRIGRQGRQCAQGSQP
jgi:hypothetical protein